MLEGEAQLVQVLAPAFVQRTRLALFWLFQYSCKQHLPAGRRASVILLPDDPPFPEVHRPTASVVQLQRESVADRVDYDLVVGREALGGQAVWYDQGGVQTLRASLHRAPQGRGVSWLNRRVLIEDKAGCLLRATRGRHRRGRALQLFFTLARGHGKHVLPPEGEVDLAAAGAPIRLADGEIVGAARAAVRHHLQRGVLLRVPADVEEARPGVDD